MAIKKLSKKYSKKRIAVFYFGGIIVAVVFLAWAIPFVNKQQRSQTANSLSGQIASPTNCLKTNEQKHEKSEVLGTSTQVEISYTCDNASLESIATSLKKDLSTINGSREVYTEVEKKPGYDDVSARFTYGIDDENYIGVEMFDENNNRLRAFDTAMLDSLPVSKVNVQISVY